MHWQNALMGLISSLALVSSVSAGDASTEWGAKFNETLEECGEKIDNAYSPLHVSHSALDIETLSISSGPPVLVSVKLLRPLQGVNEIFWTAKNLESAHAFVDVLKRGTFKRLIVERAKKSAHEALNKHKIFLLLALSFGDRDPRHDETLKKLHQFVLDLQNCPTPNLIKIFNPCLRCPIKAIEKTKP